MSSIFCDLESYSTQPDALVISFAAIAVDTTTREVIDTIDIRPCIISQIHQGRHICPQTIAFHRKRGTLADRNDKRLHLSEFTSIISDFFKKHDPARVWIQGPDFDAPILYPFFARIIIEHLFNSIGGKLPWDFWKTRDSRTCWDIAFPGETHPPRPHTAIEDCYATLRDTIAALTALDRLSSL